MKFSHSDARIFVPDEMPVAGALGRITHLGIGAHQDDLEFMAFHGIQSCYRSSDRWFGGVTCTTGGGCARSGPYADFSDDAMQRIRSEEQDQAALVGGYAAMVQLGFSSSAVNDPDDEDFKNDLNKLLIASRPEIVYTHNPADKHDTHIGVAIASLLAMRELPQELRPKKVIGCEVWRGLDWLVDEDKYLMDVSGRDHLANALNGIFDSQIAGGKRYDLAISGRRAANATFLDSHESDGTNQMIYGIDLTPLVEDETTDILDFMNDLMDRFKADVCLKVGRRLGQL